MPPRILVRADASVAIGSGHVMRCLTLADVLREKGASVEFSCRPLDGNLCALIESRGFTAHKLAEVHAIDSVAAGRETAAFCQKQDAEATANTVAGRLDWIVVDHYKIGAEWESAMREHADKIFVIDDLADRSHDCDLLLDQNYYKNAGTRYDERVSKACRLLLGPAYALVAPEFEKTASTLPPRPRSITKVLVFFGGSDPTGETLKALDAIESIDAREVSFDVIVGANNPVREAIRVRCERLSNVRYFCQTREMAPLCAKADLALGAGGSANWERFILCLPSLVVTTADNQKATVAALREDGYIRWLGWHAEVDAACMASALNLAFGDSAELQSMGKRACRLMKNADGHGVLAVANAMCLEH